MHVAVGFITDQGDERNTFVKAFAQYNATATAAAVTILVLRLRLAKAGCMGYPSFS